MSLFERFLLQDHMNSEDKHFGHEDDWLLSIFDNYNVYLYGPKRSGKDATFAHVIYLRNEPYYADIRYDDNILRLIDIGELNLGGNGYGDIINGTVEKIEPAFAEYIDIFITDGSVKLGAQNCTELNKGFPDMPVFFGINSHLYASHIHVNGHQLMRLWDKLREQQDAYVHIVGHEETEECLYVTMIYYDRYETAQANIYPLPDLTHKRAFGSKEHKEKIEAFQLEKDVFHAKYGAVEKHTIRIFWDELKYDSRHFKKVFFKNIKEVKKACEAKYKTIKV